jgi:hypothetical protein
MHKTATLVVLISTRIAYLPAVQEMGTKILQAALALHERVSSTFRKTAVNFHYEFTVRQPGLHCGRTFTLGPSQSPDESASRLPCKKSPQLAHKALQELQPDRVLTPGVYSVFKAAMQSPFPQRSATWPTCSKACS